MSRIFPPSDFPQRVVRETRRMCVRVLSWAPQPSTRSPALLWLARLALWHGQPRPNVRAAAFYIQAGFD